MKDAGELVMSGGKVGRPSIAWPWSSRVRELLTVDPTLRTAELFRRIRLQGYPGGKSSFYQLVALCRPRPQGDQEKPGIC
jgi:hypothetical protein